MGSLCKCLQTKRPRERERVFLVTFNPRLLFAFVFPSDELMREALDRRWSRESGGVAKVEKRNLWAIASGLAIG